MEDSQTQTWFADPGWWRRKNHVSDLQSFLFHEVKLPFVEIRWKHPFELFASIAIDTDLVQILSAFLNLWAISGKPHMSAGVATKPFHKHLLGLPDNHLSLGLFVVHEVFKSQKSILKASEQ